MSGPANWSYVQARLQARHGERLSEDAWRVLDGTKSIDHFLDRSRATSLRTFLERLDAQMSSHMIECLLRAEWRRYVAEVADWVPPVWKQPVLWVSHVPDLPIIDGLLKTVAPQWVREDQMLAAFVDESTRKSATTPANSRLATSLRANNGTVAERWVAHWRALWPRRRAIDRQGLEELCMVIADNYGRIARASTYNTPLPYRHEMTRGVIRIFRRRAGTAAALFSHLTLFALDLERARGALVRRRLFDVTDERRIA